MTKRTGARVMRQDRTLILATGNDQAVMNTDCTGYRGRHGACGRHVAAGFAAPGGREKLLEGDPGPGHLPAG